MSSERKLHVVVAVLGDLGRSPRMQYHCHSLLEGGHTVSFIGYEGEDLVPGLQKFEDTDQFNVIRFHVPAPNFLRKILPIYFLWRILSLAAATSWALFVSVKHRPPIDCLILQNPPAMPLFLIAYLYCQTMQFVQGYKPGLVVDWHNLGYSMLNPGIFQTLAKVYEKWMAPLADGHFTVTKAMKNFLLENMNIADESTIDVLYDCPPAMFRQQAMFQIHELLMKLDKETCAVCPKSWYTSKNHESQSIFTESHARTTGIGGVDGSQRSQHDGDLSDTSQHSEHSSLNESERSQRRRNRFSNMYRWRPGRPALVISSTSWTPDEDFGILLEALVQLDARIQKEQIPLKVMVIVTGKGPQKEMYQERMSKLMLQSVAIQTVWLEPVDYPKILACADVGVSLHTSTSGLDLPMKILDMFGCEVPVCAVNFDCLGELVQDNVNGRIFHGAQDLSHLLWDLLSPMPMDTEVPNHSFGTLNRFSRQLQGRRLWHENWKSQALPIIRKVSSMSR